MKITTKKGDEGETGLFDGKRVSKGDKVMNVLGDLDELQCFLGMCKLVEGVETKMVEIIERIQNDLYRIMAIIGYEEKCPPSCKMIDREDIEFLELSGDEYDIEDGEMGARQGFVIPGSDELNARINVARAVCRRAERSMVRLVEKGKKGEVKDYSGDVSGIILQYLNRLSDLLFVMGER